MGDDYWQRDLDRRADDARYDRQRAERDRVETDQHGWQALAGGNTFEAIRAVAGPDAALYYADRLADDDKDTSDDGEWPPHIVATDLDEFLENLYALAYPVTTRVAGTAADQVKIEAVDRSDGDAVVGAFWAPARVVAAYIEHTDALVLSDSSERFVRQLRRVLKELEP